MKVVVCALLILTFVSSLLADAVYNGLVLKDVNRNIDLSTNIVRHTIQTTVQNAGEKVTSYVHLAFTAEQAEKLAFVSATDSDNRNLKTSKSSAVIANKDAVLYKINLRSELKAKESVKLTIKIVYTHALEAYPKSIKQSENQKFVYHENHFLYSPYFIATQKTNVKLAGQAVDAFTEEQPTRRSGDAISYGPYDNKKPLSISPMRVHFQNNYPFVTITNVDRLFEVSHWGNLAVEENYELKHDGAKLKGTFSRLDYQRNPAQTAPSSFRTLIAKIPKSSEEIYFRDEIGNISSSDIRVSGNQLEVELNPRYPLFGGWKTKFIFGYNTPLSQSLKVSGNVYTLTLDFGIPFSSAVVDHQVIRVVLPESSKDISVNAPFDLDKQSFDVMKTYLDTTGRPVVIIEKNHVVPEHNQAIQIVYTFNKSSMLQEPLLLAGALFSFFVAVMIYVRLDINIAPKLA